MPTTSAAAKAPAFAYSASSRQEVGPVGAQLRQTLCRRQNRARAHAVRSEILGNVLRASSFYYSSSNLKIKPAVIAKPFGITLRSGHVTITLTYLTPKMKYRQLKRE